MLKGIPILDILVHAVLCAQPRMARGERAEELT